MKRFSILALVLVIAVAAHAKQNEGKFRKTERSVPGQYIVVLADDVEDVAALADDPARTDDGVLGTERDQVFTIADNLARTHAGVLDYVYTNALRGFSVRMTEGMARGLSNHPQVAWVEEDGEVSADTTQTNATWGLDRIDQRDRPLNGTFVYTRTGSGVKAYIIDTGILRTHTQFGGRAIHGFTAINDGRGSTDCNGHGTHVSGTVGGSTYGVAKGVTLVAVRVLGCTGSGTNSGVIAGVDWVRGDHPAGAPAVANMSLGGGASSALDTAVNNCINDGVTFAVAAGNSNTNACNSSPARVPAAITVGSSTSTDARSSFSNFGTCVDLFAPGSSITSAWYTSTSATRTISGTSMASPHAAGVAVLYLQGNPGASPATVRNALVNNSTTNRLTNIGSGSPNRLLFTNY